MYNGKLQREDIARSGVNRNGLTAEPKMSMEISCKCEIDSQDKNVETIVQHARLRAVNHHSDVGSGMGPH